MNKNVFGLFVVMLLVATIFQSSNASASILKTNGEWCILNAECQSGWCVNDKCVPNPCNDGTCDLQVDCHLCEEVNGMKGDCQVSSCGFESSRCYDGICEPPVDCYCYEGGDCDSIQCATNGFLNASSLGLVVGVVVSIGILSYGYKKSKRR